MITIIIGIIVSITMFSIIVLAHEWGHFSTSRLFGVRVEEFGLGLPPRAKKIFKDKKGTIYTLNWLPLGGFVKLTGEMQYNFLVYDENKKLYKNDELEKAIKASKDIYSKDGKKIGKQEKEEILNKLEENNADYNLANKPAIQQSIIILAGVFMNFLLASIIFSVLFFIGVKPIGINTQIETNLDLKLIPNYNQALESGILIKKDGIILGPIDGSIAQKSGIIEGDILYQIGECNNNNCDGENNIKLSVMNNPNDLTDIIKNNVGKDIIFYIESTNQQGLTNKKILKISIPKEGKIGTYISDNIEINQDFEYNYPIFKSIKYGFLETYNQSFLTLKGVGLLVGKIINPQTPQERDEAISQVSGPIGIVDFISESMSAGIIFIVIIGAIISINLGVFNLLPIPALDGGRFIFITLNGIIKRIFGKKIINQQIEGIIHVGFFLFLIALSLLIAYNDIYKIISR